jgi:hypothetical protein
MHPLLERFILKIDVDSSYDVRNGVLLLTTIIGAFLIVSNALLQYNYINVSNAFLLAAVVYGFPFVLVCKQGIERWSHTLSGAAKMVTNASKDIVLTVVVLVITVMLLDVMFLIAISGAKLLTFSIALVLLVAPTFFWNRLYDAFGFLVTRRIFPVLMVFLVVGGVSAQNDTISSTIGNIQSGLDILSTVSGYLQSLLNYMGAIKDFFAGLGLDSMQTNAVLIIGGLIFFYFVLKFLKTVVKWAIVFIIIWIGLQIAGVI